MNATVLKEAVRGYATVEERASVALRGVVSLLGGAENDSNRLHALLSNARLELEELVDAVLVGKRPEPVDVSAPVAEAAPPAPAPESDAPTKGRR